VLRKLAGETDGAFVIQDSLSQRAFMLSYRYNGTTRNMAILNAEDGVHLHGASSKFTTLAELVQHYVYVHEPLPLRAGSALSPPLPPSLPPHHLSLSVLSAVQLIRPGRDLVRSGSLLDVRARGLGTN